MSVTVGSVTVIITDYQPKKKDTHSSEAQMSSDNSDTNSSSAGLDPHDHEDGEEEEEENHADNR